MAYTVQPDHALASEIHQEDLRHHYYIQLAPDGKRLVPGVLKQNPKAHTGRWLDVTKVDRDFPVRYFVEYTHFNTLVPGSLIQAARLPEGNWKEVKKPHILFHRVAFDDPYQLFYFVSAGDPTVSTYTFATQDNFINNRVTPALAAIYPNIPNFNPPDLSFHLPNSKNLHCNLYYFQGTYAELNKDVSKLIPVSNAHSFYIANNVNAPQPGTNISTKDITLNSLIGKSNAPNGSYCIVLEMLDVSNQKEYVVLENVLESTAVVFG